MDRAFGYFSSATGRLLCFSIWLIARIVCSPSLDFSSMGLLDCSRFLSYFYFSMNFPLFRIKGETCTPLSQRGAGFFLKLTICKPALEGDEGFGPQFFLFEFAEYWTVGRLA